MSAPLSLPGQAAAHPGPCDMTGMYLMHHAFRRDLARFASAARHTPAGEAATWRALAARWARFAHELHDHHRKEDEALWPLLLERVDAVDDSFAHDVLEAMEAEHALIDPLLASVEAGLAALAGGASSAVRDRLADDLDEVRAVLGDHLAHEEREAIPVMHAYFSAEEWTHLEETRLAAKPGPGQLLWLLPWLADGLTAADLAPLLAAGGVPLRVLLRLGRRRYERGERRAFAHAR